MPTTVTKTIGTGGDYTTLQAWEDASPANLVTVDQIWQGQCFNQEFFSSSAALLNVSGSTTDATRYKELTTYAGASFVDNASVQTNALRYNASNGAGIRNSYAWGGPVSVNESYFRISKLQIAAGNAVGFNGTATTGLVIDKCIFENSSTGNEPLKTYGVCTVKNSLMVQRSTATCAALSNGTNVYNCTFVRTGSSTGNIFTGSYGTSTLQNCAFFGGATTLASGGTSKTYVTCYTDTASPPSGCTTVAYNTSTGSGFQNITDATRDFRIKTGSALLDVGTTDTTNAAYDIVGTARPQGSAYDVGAWELVVAGATTHTSTGALATAGAAVAGTAARFRAFATTGALAPTGAVVAGTAARAGGGPTTHDGTGALATTGAVVAGTAARFRAFATSGVLSAAGAEVVGSATRFRAFATSGVLSAAGAAVAGSATRFRTFGTSGALATAGAAVVGTSLRYRTMGSSGALVTAGATVAGTAARFREHGTSGALAAAGASITGSALRLTPGGGVYPAPADVRAGVIYGPTGAEFTGTMSILLDLNTGRLVKIIGQKVALLL